MSQKILVLGTAEQAYREYVLHSIASRYEIHLLVEKAPGWEKPYIHAFHLMDPQDSTAVLALARKLHEQENFAGVMTFHEMMVELCALLAEALGLPGNSPEAASACRDKHKMRKALEKAAVPSAQSILAGNLDEARAAAGRIGYPLVLKPCSLAASIGVVKVETDDELEDAYSIAASASYPGAPAQNAILVEEFLDGPEVSVESVVVNDAVHIIAITEKSLAFPPYFEELGHLVSAGEKHPETARIETVVQNAHRALGIHCGVTHTELRLTHKGPCTVEVGARLGGDLIPYLAWKATGIDLALAAADVACGLQPDLQKTRSLTAGIRFFYPPNDGRFVTARHQANLGVDANLIINITAQTGALLRLPPRGFGARYGYVIITGNSRAECQQRLDAIADSIEIELAPLRSLRR
jgi:biotin carboxylase